MVVESLPHSLSTLRQIGEDMDKDDHEYGDNDVCEDLQHVVELLEDACYEAVLKSFDTGECFVVFLNRRIPNVLPSNDTYVRRLRSLKYVKEYFLAVPWLAPNRHLSFDELFGGAKP